VSRKCLVPTRVCTPWAVVDRCRDGTLAQLLAAGRYEEALASQQHLDAVAQREATS